MPNAVATGVTGSCCFPPDAGERMENNVATGQ